LTDPGAPPYDSGDVSSDDSRSPGPSAETRAGKPGTPRTADWPADPEGDTGLGPGTRVGEYVIEKQIGEGGMGLVFAAVHPVIGKHVAIKVLNPSLAGDATSVQRFIQEARAVNQIGHRNIVDIFGFGELPSGRHYFVMELLKGQSLKQRLASPLGDAEAFAVLGEICDALGAAHAAGVVHRDLKPDNIFISDESRVKLLDFGIAKLTENPAVLSTQAGQPMGTPRYMSPEQRLGRPIDLRTDLYALGVMMFEIFGSRDQAIGLGTLIHACLAEDPSARPESAAEIRARLDELAARLRPKPPPPRTPTWAVVLAVVGAIALPILLTLGIYELLDPGMVIKISSDVGWNTDDAGRRIDPPR
jgi:serine/threonine-protein kinase